MRSKRARCCCIEARDRRLLEKIISYCRRIGDNLDRYRHDYEVFLKDAMFQDARCMCVIQIGELVGELSDEAKAMDRSVPWRVIKDTRNFYVHAYGAIDLPSVWETLVHDIPALQLSCERLLNSSP